MEEPQKHSCEYSRAAKVYPASEQSWWHSSIVILVEAYSWGSARPPSGSAKQPRKVYGLSAGGVLSPGAVP